MIAKNIHTAKGSARKQLIIDKAIHILWKQGVADLGYETLSQATGLARPHIKYYFDSKEALLLECFEYIAGQAQQLFQTHIESQHNWKERALAFAEASFLLAERHPDYVAVLILYYYYCCVNPKLAQVQKTVRTIGKNRLQSILQTGFVDKKEQWIDNLAFNIQMYLTGVVIEMVTTGGLKDKSYERRALAHVKMLLDSN